MSKPLESESRIFSGIALAIVFFFCASCSHLNEGTDNSIFIVSYLVRDAIIPLNPLEMRTRIIVGFRIHTELLEARNRNVSGELYYKENRVARAAALFLDGPEIMVTYPWGALVSTPVWEAAREGIAD